MIEMQKTILYNREGMVIHNLYLDIKTISFEYCDDTLQLASRMSKHIIVGT